MRAKILHTLKNAIVTLSRFPNPHTNDGAKRQALVGEFTRLVNEIEAEKYTTYYEAQVVYPTGSWYKLQNDDGDTFEGVDFEKVLTAAKAEIAKNPLVEDTRLMIAKLEVTYIEVPGV